MQTANSKMQIAKEESLILHNFARLNETCLPAGRLVRQAF